MAFISHAFLLSIFLVLTTLFTSINAQLHVLYSLPYTAPAPSPATHHHHPGAGHHHHAHAPAVAPGPYSPATSPPPSKPVVPKPPVTPKPPITYPTPSVPPVNPPTKSPVVKPPTQPPVKPPTYPPPPVKPPTVKPPTYPPAKPPTSAPAPYSPPEKEYVAVQGMVYCKSNCTYAGIDTLLGSSPLPGARIVIRCRNTKYLLRKTATTDEKGYFLLQVPPQVTTYGAHKCKVYLARKQKKTSSGSCTHAAKLNSGDSGAVLYQMGPPKHLPLFSLYTVGPFAFEPLCSKH